MELRERLLLHALGKRCVANRLLLALAVGEGPVEECDERLALVGVLLVDVREDVGVGRDRISRVARAVDDRRLAEVRGNLSAMASAAAVTPSTEPGTNLPAAFLMRALLRPETVAYSSST